MPSRGVFTGYLFRVTGNRIQTVHASIDRGGLYRYQKLTNLTKKDVEAFDTAETNGTLKVDFLSSGRNRDGSWYSEQMKALGTSFSENWAAGTSYGFWLPPEDAEKEPDQDLREAAHKRIDLLNGAALTITVTFQDGSHQTETLHLKTGKLKVAYGKDKTRIVLPEPAGGSDPYVYSVYAELKN